MSRARGRHGPREPQISEAEAREYGIRDTGTIPGGLEHLANPPVRRYQPPVPPKLAPFRGQDAHGVPPQDVGEYNREMQRERSHPYDPKFADQKPGPSPVPVYIVEKAGGPRPLNEAATGHLTVQAASGQPVPVCGQDSRRSLVQLLNMDTTNHIRFGKLEQLQYDPANEVITGGSRLPAAATGYTVIRTQGDLWAISENSDTPALSYILEYGIPDAL